MDQCDTTCCDDHLTLSGILVAVLLVWELPTEEVCARQLWHYLLGYVALLAGCLLLEALISAVAMRGSILDTEARASMQYLLYVRLGIMCLELIWLVAGVVWLAYHYRNCPAHSAKEVALGLVICNWCVLLSILMTVWCTFDAAGRSWVKMKEYQRSTRDADSRRPYRRSTSTSRNWRQRKVIRAYQDSWNHRCRLLFCCMGNSDRNRNSFADIARLLSEFFRDLDVVPSDVVAGLVLLRKFQKIEREAVVKERRNDTYEFLSGVPVTPATQFVALTEAADLGRFRDAVHYMHFALAAYGWPMFLVTYSATGVCQLCASIRCSCLWCAPPKDPAVIVEDNCCRCNYAALRRMVDVGDVAVVYATYHVDVGETPFFVAVDYTKRKIVISIRGTLSLQDVITDLNAEGEPLPLDPVREDWLGHKGMVQAAEYIRQKLREECILEAAFGHDPERGSAGFELVLVGHSLGAGTAAILATLLRQHHPTLTCFAYSPPGGTLSMPAAEYSKQFITSVVVGKDVVPRIGLHQLESLRADLINTIKRSKDPKWKTIFCSAVCCGCAPMPTSAAELQGDSSLCEYRRERQAARAAGAAAVHPSDPSIALTVHQPLYPPGRIIHVVRHHPSKGEQKYEKRWRQVLNKHEPVYQAVWASTTDFDEVLISPVMIQDHMPDNVLDALNKVITTVGPAKPRRASACASSTPAEHLQPLLAAAPAASAPAAAAAVPATAPGSPKASTPPHRLCLETSFTSLQSPGSEPQQLQLPLPCGRQHAASAGPLGWEFPALLLHEDQVTSPAQDGPHDEWFGLAPLATPESLSEVSSISSRASWLLADGPAPPAPPPPPPPPAASAAPRPATSSADDLSFASARQTTATATSSDDCERTSGRRTSSEAFLSVRGTPSSSDDSVTATVEVHLPRECAQGIACSDSPAAVSLPTPARCLQPSPLLPAGATVARIASAADVTAPNSVKQVKFTHKHRGSTVTASAVRQAVSCDRAARGDRLPGTSATDFSQPETLDNDTCRSESNNNGGSGKVVGGRHTQQNAARSTPAVVRSRRDCRSDRRALESLPLLSGIASRPDGVSPYPREKYTYPITAVGKGESSV
ncbi:diacylglycerol lipase-alpha [Schistocerca gregaria]|uniref:diacylglycerol lipase-alpha n=1 Tax=Schistocerca gregaria TaxID=7010 RepID=UPI00211EA3A8|nr:diacylglycerol lipase-alpha [Schistocerca gregaria]